MAIERLVAPQRGDGTGKRVRMRAAAVYHLSWPDTVLGNLCGEMSRYYNLRSHLVHGDISPFHPTVTANANACVRFAEKVLSGALMLFDGNGLFDMGQSNEELSEAFERLAQSVFDEDKRLRRTAKNTTKP